MLLSLTVCCTCTVATVCLHFQDLASAGIYIPPTYNSPPIPWPLISHRATHPIYQSRVSAVITCVWIYLCSPHPVPKSRIRVQSGWETRSPPGFSSSCYRVDSLPDYNSSFSCILPWEIKQMLELEAQLFSWLFPDCLTPEGLMGHFGAFCLSFLPVYGLTDLSSPLDFSI